MLPVVQKRSELLHLQGKAILPDVGFDSDKGRMLLYSREDNVADGASEAASGRFVDLYDAPPWDIWVAYSDRTLLAPPELIGLAQRGIDANPRRLHPLAAVRGRTRKVRFGRPVSGKPVSSPGLNESLR